MEGSRVRLLRGSCATLGIMGCSFNFEVEAFLSWIVAAIIGVRAAEAIVASLKEAHESFWVATTGKVSASPFIFS